MGWRDRTRGAVAPFLGITGYVGGAMIGGPVGAEVGKKLGVAAGTIMTPELQAQLVETNQFGSKSWLTDFTGELEKGASENKISDLMSSSPADLEKMVSHYQGKEIKAAGFTDAKDYLDTLKERSQTRKKTRDMTLLQPGTKQTILTTGIRE